MTIQVLDYRPTSALLSRKRQLDMNALSPKTFQYSQLRSLKKNKVEESKPPQVDTFSES